MNKFTKLRLAIWQVKKFWLWHIGMYAKSAFGGGYLAVVTKQRDDALFAGSAQAAAELQPG